jgi:hypothetical protein
LKLFFGTGDRVARFYLVEYTKTGENIPNDQKIPNGRKIYQHYPLQDPPKFTQIGIFALKICHLATLAGVVAAE